MGLMLYLGIDGGQTRTRALLADATGRVLGIGVAGPSNHVEVPGGRERLRAAVTGSANAALRQAGFDDVGRTRFAAVYCAMTGEADFKTEIIAPAFSAGVVRVEHDAPAALEGATLGEPGIIVVAGTGSVVFGRNAAGESSRAGGWGYVFGDEGGAFGLAREGVRRALDALDGVGPGTDLVDRLTSRFGLADLRPLPMVMYNGHVSRDAVAQAARDVIEAWQSGDGVAAAIVEAGVAALADRVASGADRLRLTGPLVCLTGGVCRSRPYAASLTAGIRARQPGAEVRAARMSPAAGAVLLAYRAGGLEVTEAMRTQLLDSASEDRS